MPVARRVAAHPTTRTAPSARRLSVEFWAILGATGTMLTVTVTLAAFVLSNQNNAAEDRRSMREEIQSIRGEIRSVRGEIHSLRSDIQSEIRSLRTEFQTEIRALRSEIRDEISSIRAVPDSARE